MGISEEIKKMQQEGKSESQIIEMLQMRNVSMDEIQEAVSQAKIKQAVGSSYPYSEEDEQKMTHLDSSNQNMEPSLLAPQSQDAESELPLPPQSQEPAQNPVQYQTQDSQAQAYPDQYAYDSYSSSFNADTISEIAEQVVAEKLSSLRAKIESILDMRVLLESKIESIDSRLQRMEKTIDRLQLSVLQKVGDYMTNVEDIKTELQETQKSFKAMLAERTGKTPSKSKDEFKEIE